jgi:glycosyltransferase involved in cell wall biosynthesis
MKKIRVLIIGALPPPPGGMEVLMQAMVKIKLKKFEIIPMNVAKTKNIRSNKIFNSLNFMYRIIKLIGILLFKKIDIVHIHVSSGWGFWQKSIYQQIASMMGKKTILHMHGGPFVEFYNSQKGIKRKIINRTLTTADRIIALTPGWKSFYKKITSEEKIDVIANFVDIPNIQKKYKRIPGRILFVGRVQKEKGIYELLEAIRLLDDKKISLAIVGPLDIAQKDIKEHIKKLGISKNVEIIGAIPNEKIKKYYLESELFVLPSYYECMPISILEALTYGLPIISTDVGGIPEIISKSNGAIVKPKNPKELSEAIKEIIYNKRLREHIRQTNLQLSKTYSKNKFIKNLEKTYEQTASKKY